MFDFVAKHKRWLQIFIGLAMIPFAFFGLEAYTRSVGGAQEVANVDGYSVTQREFGEELRRQQDRLRDMLGRGADPAQFDTPEMRLAILDGVISQRLVLGEVVKSRLVMSKEEVVASILAAPEFQEGGKFSSERYSMYLRTRGMSDEGNVAQMRVEAPAARLAAVISGSAFQSRAVAERMVALLNEKREVSEALVAADQFAGRVKPDEASVKAFFESNLAEFKVPERVRAEYLVLSAEEMGRSEAPSDAELKEAYDRLASQLGVAEQRRASHILVKTKEEAQKVAEEARKDPKRFAALAKKHSLDTGSAENGGDLGMNARGALAGKSLEDAVFQLKSGEIGGPVQSEFGYHVLRLTAIQAGKVPSLDEVKKDLAAEIAKQKGAKKFAEAADAFNNLVYEQSDSLKPAAERYKLKLAASGWIQRQDPGLPSSEHGLLAHPKLIAALFSPDSIQQRRNTDAVEVAPGVLVAARVAEHQPEAQRPLADVRAEVERRIVRRDAAALAQKEGAEKLALLAKGGDAGLKWSAPKLVSRRDMQGLPATALRKVMAADVAKLPALVGMESGDSGYAIYRVTRVVAGEFKAGPQSAEELAVIDRQTGSEQLDAYVASLRARAKVEINRSNLEKK
jgi:peptidyl-prolyl cis-trans isomerase D